MLERARIPQLVARADARFDYRLSGEWLSMVDLARFLACARCKVNQK